MSSRRTGVLILNPAAGQYDLAQRVGALIPQLATAGVALDLRTTSGPGDASLIAREAVAAGAQVVAVCGGDGTINEAAIAVAGSPASLAILPAGTANVLARELEIPRSLRSAARALAEGVEARISVGVAGDRRFLMMAGFGFDAVVLTNFSPFLKRHLGRVAYAARCAEELARLHPPRLRITSGDESFEGSMVVAANIKLYGGDFVIAPDADPTDEFLDVVVLKGSTRLDYMRYLGGVLARRLHAFSDVTVFRASEVRVECDDGPVAGQIDGDSILTTPVDLRVEPRALGVIVPEGSRYAR